MSDMSIYSRFVNSILVNLDKQTSGSHPVFKIPWQGDPRINLQDDSGKAKPDQVKQVLADLDKLKTL